MTPAPNLGAHLKGDSHDHDPARAARTTVRRRRQPAAGTAERARWLVGTAASPASPAPPAGGYAPPPPPYAGGYGQPPPGYGAAPQAALAEWPKRAYAALIDFVGPWILVGLIYRGSTALGAILWLAALAWGIYNAYLGGQTGQSYGKKIAGTRLLLEATGQPPGGGLGIGRFFLHILDSIPCYIGYLWPLWDAKKQTFADKIVKTLVVTA